MKTCFTLALLILIGFFACRRDPLPIEPTHPLPRLALMIGFDVSETYNHRPRPDERFLRESATLISLTGGAISLKLIATPDSANDFIRAYFQAMPPEPPKNATYTAQIDYAATCDSVRRYNDRQIETFVSACVLLLAQEKDHQHSDLNGLLLDADTYFQEADVSDCLPMLYLATDGLQDVRLAQRTDTTLQPAILTRRHAKVFCVGWKNPVLPQNWKRLVSHEGMLKEIQSLIQ